MAPGKGRRSSLTMATGGQGSGGASSTTVGNHSKKTAMANNAAATTGSSQALSSKPSSSFSLDPLMISLREHDAAFTSLLKLIPPKFYLVEEDVGLDGEDADAGINARFQKNKRKKDKEIEAAQRKTKAKEAKRAKLDPDNLKTVDQIQKERAARAQANGRAEKGDEMQGLDFSVGSDLQAGDADGEEGDESDDGDNDNEEEARVAPAVNGSVKPAATVSDLRARLQARIYDLQAKRRAPGLTSSNSIPLGGGNRIDAVKGTGDMDEWEDEDASVASTRDELLEERRRKRGEMRDNRRRARKEAIRAATMGQGKKQGKEAAQAPNGASNSAADKKTLNHRAPALLVSESSAKGSTSSAKQQQVNDVAFSALDFGSLDKAKSRHALPSDPKVALAMLEARKRKEEKRAEKMGGEEANDDAVAKEKERKERERWSKAEAAAQGVKIRDDEALLRKAVKKRDKIKDKSRKAWQDREKEQRDQQAARQKKRQDNIANKKDRGKKSKKTGGAKGGGGKKGTKARPGFEGKSTFGRAGKAGSARKSK